MGKYIIFTFPADGPLLFKYVSQVKTKRQARAIAQKSEINGELSVILKVSKIAFLHNNKLF